jgi:SAM-dependent methyltransferase
VTSQMFRRMFRDATLQIDDLFLLESFQISHLPGWVPEQELGVVLGARPEIARFFATRCPEIAAFVDSVIEKHGDPASPEQVIDCGDEVVWTIADLIVYNKCPEVYDRLPFHDWDFAEITSIVDLVGRTVIDCGAGTGRVALEAADTAALVFAVEPVSRLRQFIRTEARSRALRNLYVVDGLGHSLPFPDSFADVIITSHALGWRLTEELAEFERVVEKPGTIIHCPGTAVGAEKDRHAELISAPWGYRFSEFDEADGRKRKYWKRV